MPIKNKQKSQEVKVKDDKTAQQEQCSVVAIYYYMTKQMSDQKNKDKLSQIFKEIYPDIATSKDGVKWENTFMEQGEVFAGSKYYSGKDYKFGWWDAPTKAVNSTKFAKAVDNNTTTVLTEIWEMFDKETKKIFGNKKDTWNTADMYLVKNGKGSSILKFVKSLKKDIEPYGKETFVGVINTYLTSLLKDKILIPISLKKKTDNKKVSIKETNIHEFGESGKIDVVSAEFTKNPWAYFNVIPDGSEITFGAVTGRGGNSFQYFAEFQVSDYKTGYLVEQRLAGQKTKAEVKDIVLNNKGQSVRAAAQTGQVPQPEFESLIKDYSGEEYDYNVPELNQSMTTTQVEYWKKYLSDVESKKDTIGLNLNGFTVLGTDYPVDTVAAGLSWIEKVAEIDNDYLRDPTSAAKKYNNLVAGNFHAEFRLKLKQLRFIRAMQKANGKLEEIIVYLYYLAAKQNISEADIHGPFLKIA